MGPENYLCLDGRTGLTEGWTSLAGAVGHLGRAPQPRSRGAGTGGGEAGRPRTVQFSVEQAAVQEEHSVK